MASKILLFISSEIKDRQREDGLPVWPPLGLLVGHLPSAGGPRRSQPRVMEFDRVKQPRLAH